MKATTLLISFLLVLSFVSADSKEWNIPQQDVTSSNLVIDSDLDMKGYSIFNATFVNTTYINETEFVGDIHTDNIYPNAHLTYDIGTNANRYRIGYFQDVRVISKIVSDEPNIYVEPSAGGIVRINNSNMTIDENLNVSGTLFVHEHANITGDLNMGGDINMGTGGFIRNINLGAGDLTGGSSMQLNAVGLVISRIQSTRTFVEINDDLNPYVVQSYSLGSAMKYWDTLYTRNIEFYRNGVSEGSITATASALTFEDGTNTLTLDNIDDAYDERGSQIAGDNLNWDGSELDVTGVLTSDVYVDTAGDTWTGDMNADGNNIYNANDINATGNLTSGKLVMGLANGRKGLHLYGGDFDMVFRTSDAGTMRTPLMIDGATSRIGINNDDTLWTPEAPLHIKGRHINGLGLLYLDGTEDLDHAYFTMNAYTGKSSGLFFKENSANKWLLDYVAGSNYLRFYQYSTGFNTMTIEDSTGDVTIYKDLNALQDIDMTGDINFGRNDLIEWSYTSGIPIVTKKANITFDGEDLIFRYPRKDVAYFQSNISYITAIERTSIWDKEKGSALDYFKDADDLKDIDGKIDHEAFDEYVEFEIVDNNNCSMVKNDVIVYCSLFDDAEMCYDEEPEGEYYTKVETKETKICGKKTIEGIDVSKNRAKHEQAIFEAKTLIEAQSDKITSLQEDITLLKLELCKKDITYAWCKGEITP